MKKNTRAIEAFQRKSLASAIAYLSMSMAMSPLYASDTEVYTQVLTSSGSAGASSPALMFMIDGTGRMSRCMESDADCASPNRRIDVLLSALTQALKGDTTTVPPTPPAPGYLKVGFGSNGITGNNVPPFIRYPARPLDAFVNINPDGVLTTPIADYADDALLTTPNNITTDLNLSNTLTPIGLRFGRLMVPKGATVTSAKIVLTNKSGTLLATNQITVAMENSVNAANFSTAGVRTFNADTPLTPVIDNSGTRPTYTIDVTSSVNTLVNNSSWCGGNAAAFKVTSNASSTVVVHSLETAEAAANDDYIPQLLVEFSISPTKTDSCIVAPQTATFELVPPTDTTQASINDVEWIEGSTATTASANTLSFNTITQSSTPTTTSSTSTVVANNVQTGVTTGCYNSSTAVALATAANDRGSLVCPTNTSSGGTTITYGSCVYTWAGTTSGCTGGKKKVNVTQTVSTTTTTVTTGTTYTYTYKKAEVGLRFPNITIPNGATVTSATLKIKPNQNATQATEVVGFLPTTGNLTPFCTSTSNSSCTQPSGVHNAAGSAGLTTATTKTFTTADPTVDVTSLLRSITATTGWASGNALGFRLRSNATTASNSAVNPTDGVNAVSSDQTSVRSQWPSLTVSWDGQITNLSGLKTVRQDILDELAKMKSEPTSGKSPLGRSIIEGARYLMGMTPSSDAQYAAGAYDAETGRYISPITSTTESACSGNTVFILSDGHPDDNAGINSATTALDSHLACTDFADDAQTGGQSTLQYKCLFSAVNYLQNNAPNAPGVPGTTHYPNAINSKIKVVAAQFGPYATTDAESANMKKMAEKYGGGKHYPTSSKASLLAAFLEQINALRDDGSTIAAPGVAVNQLNRLSHLNQLYYAVFEPKVNAYHWEGNLKRYGLSATGSSIVDSKGDNAVDTSTGFFNKNAQSFWSTAVDGDKAIDGGAASKLPAPSARKMYTYTGGLNDKNQPLTLIPADVTATNASTFNTWAKTKLSITDNTVYTNLMNWFRGYVIPTLGDGVVDVSTASTRKRLGAALHSQPVLVNYGYTIPTGGTLADAANPDNQKNYVFFSTLEGALHVVDANTGIEKFNFTPPEKISGLQSLYTNSQSSALPAFGMDLTWTYYRKDENNNSQIDGNDKVYLYGGMRMGGSNYYAIDATNLDAPKWLFSIQGGAGGQSDFVNMGQSWSQPVVASMKVAGVVTPVLVFGGGYDPRHEDTYNAATSDTLGNQLYIVNAVTGALIWSASSRTGATKIVTDMKFSVVTQPKVVDIDADGLADNIYFGDLGGQVFRVDLDKTATTAANLAKRVRLIAKLGQTALTTNLIGDRRRFYEAPEVALFKDSAGAYFATVVLGSGYRSHPLNQETQERFFTLFDYDTPRKDLLRISESDTSLQATLTDSDLAVLNLGTTAAANVTGKKGWYINLPDSGEKSMASALIFNSRLIFSTYVPTVVSSTACASPVIGRSKIYNMCMPYGDVCDAGVTTRTVDNVTMGIAGEPQLLIIETTPGVYTKILVTGTNVVSPAGPPGAIVPTLKSLRHWREKSRNPAN